MSIEATPDPRIAAPAPPAQRFLTGAAIAVNGEQHVVLAQRWSNPAQPDAGLDVITMPMDMFVTMKKTGTVRDFVAAGADTKYAGGRNWRALDKLPGAITWHADIAPGHLTLHAGDKHAEIASLDMPVFNTLLQEWLTPELEAQHDWLKVGAPFKVVGTPGQVPRRNRVAGVVLAAKQAVYGPPLPFIAVERICPAGIRYFRAHEGRALSSANDRTDEFPARIVAGPSVKAEVLAA